MLSASVAQKPTMAVSQGRNSAPNDAAPAPPGDRTPPRASERERIAANPPTREAAHQRSASPVAIRNGAESVSSHLMDSVPFQMNQRLMSQKAAKPRYAGSPKPMNAQAPPNPRHAGHSTPR